jgi:hypothetical protein
MMQFREIKLSVTNLLGDEAAGLFRVLGYQRQSKGADEVKDNNRLVQVYFSDGSFPKAAGRYTGSSKTHDITIDIDMSASSAAKGDLSVLNSDTSTPIQKAAAIFAIRQASEVADELIDDMIDRVYQILMDARNIDLGMPEGDVANRWVDTIKKDTLIERGDLVVKTANMKLTCRVQETIRGDLGVMPARVIFDSSTNVDGGSSTGVTVDNDNT